MKKLILLLLTGGLMPLAHAQMTLEHTYANNLRVYKMNTGEVKYVELNSGTRQVSIYNQNHTLYRQFTVPAGPAGTDFDGIDYVSDKLFNQDATLEYLAYYRHPSVVGTGYIYDTGRLYTESGTQLMQLDSTNSYSYVFNTPTGTKMRSDYYSRAFLLGTSNVANSRIYALGGTYVSLKTTAGTTAGQTGAYPNPARDEVRLPYTLPAGQTGTLTVLDNLGRTVDTFPIGAAFKELVLPTQRLPHGVYLYRVTTSAGTGSAQRFVVE